MRLPAIAFAIVLSVAPRSSAAATVVLMPLDNCSGVESAQTQIATGLTAALQKRGWTVIAGETIEPILEVERVRYVDSLEPQVVHKVVEATGASAIVTGTIYTFTESRNSTVALAARMSQPDGTVAWANLAAISSDDSEGLLGFGRKGGVNDVAAAAVESLTRTLPKPAEIVAPGHGRSKPLFRSGPASFRAKDLDTSRPLRVCVLPFENMSSTPEAARVIADVLALRLSAVEGFEIVSPSLVRAAALETRIGSFRGVDTDALAKLARAVGTPLFIRGTIYDYTDPSTRFGGEAELQLEWSLVDVSTGRVLWASQHARKGRDYVGFLMRGNVTSSVALTDRVITEMVDSKRSATPKVVKKHETNDDSRSRLAASRRSQRTQN